MDQRIKRSNDTEILYTNRERLDLFIKQPSMIIIRHPSCPNGE